MQTNSNFERNSKPQREASPTKDKKEREKAKQSKRIDKRGLWADN